MVTGAPAGVWHDAESSRFIRLGFDDPQDFSICSMISFFSYLFFAPYIPAQVPFLINYPSLYL
ncbi:uncharacterized protein ANIA_10015 [Aspergillus nidulans FGSC A4]|uniref:Uncharacterized protein n=1 Tax=Emericella nidulans (strain FGSC A4 / ATCC 38163 / CBS 112.46 / NRRL 194 / M139) TaxID=227321 RepID=C8VQZ5_EMENI|nr:hypothetical protein [Aspergillus nidulans FGSC A4]CBF90236.1 TPA: hypothetical protein ANIA_10015 [Aspergillus nidulans FGSC A4]